MAAEGKQRWRLVIDFEGDRDSWKDDEDWMSPVGIVVNKTKELGEFVQGRMTGFSFGRVDDLQS